MSRAGCFPTAIFRAVDASQGLIDFIGALGGIRTPDPQDSKFCPSRFPSPWPNIISYRYGAKSRSNLAFH